MRIEKVTKNTLMDFIEFPDKLYADDPNYVPYMRGDLKRTLNRLLFEKKKYTALMALNDNNQVVGRVLFTIGKDKQLATDKCGFFSMYECIDDGKVASKLIGEMCSILEKHGAEYVSGPFFPHDPENRRGIMVEGFDRAPLIYTSYNPPYYADQMETAGLAKHTDTLEYVVNSNERLLSALKLLSRKSLKEYDYHVDNVDLKHPEKDIDDIHKIMSSADHGVIYQDAPSRDMISQMFYKMKNIIDPDVVFIARCNDTNEPIGFVLSIPDFNQVIRKMHGRVSLRGIICYLFYSKRVTGLRCVLQYVIPQFQQKGTLASLYASTMVAVSKKNYNYCEMGTIVEDNNASRKAVEKIGATICRRYRVYYKKLD